MQDSMRNMEASSPAASPPSEDGSKTQLAATAAVWPSLWASLWVDTLSLASMALPTRNPRALVGASTAWWSLVFRRTQFLECAQN